MECVKHTTAASATMQGCASRGWQGREALLVRQGLVQRRLRRLVTVRQASSLAAPLRRVSDLYLHQLDLLLARKAAGQVWQPGG